MGNISTKLTVVPVAFEAKTLRDVTQKALALNALNGIKYSFHPPQWVKDRWVVWYISDVEIEKHVDDINPAEEFILKNDFMGIKDESR